MTEITVRIPSTVIEEIEERVYARVEKRFTTPSPYFTVAEAASFLNCKADRIYQLLTQRRLSRVKEGGRTLLLRAEIEALPSVLPKRDPL